MLDRRNVFVPPQAKSHYISLMRFRRLFCLILFLLPALPLAAETIAVESTGPANVYQTGPSPSHLIMIISGAEGWKGEVVELAKNLATADNLVLGIDFNSYRDNLKDDRFTCPCGEFSRLNMYAQRQKGFKQQSPPILIGKGEGAEIVYAAMSEAPDAFLGGISLGFCPEYSDIRRMCKGGGLKYVKKHGGDQDAFLPADNFNDPWVVFPGAACGKEMKQFASQVHGSQVLVAGKDDIARIHGIVNEWQQGYKPVQQTNALSLPLYEYPSAKNDTLFVILSGDGGYIGLDQDIGDYLSQQGLAVIGFDMLHYLWPNPSVEQGGKDLNRVLSYYLTQWKKKQAILVGYSMGADVLPFLAPQLSQENRDRLRGVVLLGPSVRSEFALDITDKKDENLDSGDLLLPHVRKITAPVLCIGGSVEKESLCRRAENNGDLPKNVVVDLIHAGHTFHDAYVEICQMISDHFHLGLK